jgi:GDP-D-mannose dehydratase
VDLNWAILQAKASADVELSTGTETTVRSMLGKAFE